MLLIQKYFYIWLGVYGCMFSFQGTNLKKVATMLPVSSFLPQPIKTILFIMIYNIEDIFLPLLALSNGLASLSGTIRVILFKEKIISLCNLL